MFLGVVNVTASCSAWAFWAWKMGLSLRSPWRQRDTSLLHCILHNEVSEVYKLFVQTLPVIFQIRTRNCGIRWLTWWRETNIPREGLLEPILPLEATVAETLLSLQVLKFSSNFNKIGNFQYWPLDTTGIRTL